MVKKADKYPWMQFYTGDWMKDPSLTMCSPATRGIWIDLLCAMHELDRSGLITGTTEQIARICRCTAVEFVQALNELKSQNCANVTFRNNTVTVVNRRMQREYKKRKGGNERVLRHRQKKKLKNNGDCNAVETVHISESEPKSKYSNNNNMCEGGKKSEVQAIVKRDKEWTDAVIAHWNILIDSKVLPEEYQCNGEPHVEMSVMELWSVSRPVQLNLEQVQTAIDNYHQALKLKHSMAYKSNLAWFCTSDKGLPKFVKGIFDINRYSRRKFNDNKTTAKAKGAKQNYDKQTSQYGTTVKT